MMATKADFKNLEFGSTLIINGQLYTAIGRQKSKVLLHRADFYYDTDEEILGETSSETPRPICIRRSEIDIV